MHAILQCGTDELTIWFSSPTPATRREGVQDFPGCTLLFDHLDVLLGLSISGQLHDLCPYELAKTASSNAGSSVDAEFQSTYDSSCDMGHIYFDQRGPASVERCADCGAVILDVGKDGAIIGMELFSASKTLPGLL
jgi:uncharacterized protein YuzE